jgi:hypothetical protein
VPHSTLAKRRRWERAYRRRRRAEEQQETKSLESEVIEFVRLYPNQLTPAMIWQALGGRYSYAEVTRCIETLLTGVLKRDMRNPLNRTGYTLSLCEIPPLPAEPSPA